MKAARIIVLMIAVGAGGVAYVLSRGSAPPPPPAAAPVEKAEETVGVLVAGRDLSVGQTVAAGDLRWQAWPIKATGEGMISNDKQPNAINELIGAVARAPFVSGEPIRDQKLIRTGGSGFMSAILPGGMRAVSAEVAEEKRAGGFILPNDRVDVMLTRTATDGQRGALLTETILTNVRVLAIGQIIDDKEGQRAVAGKAVATLELTPRQSEILASATENGTLSLALRSLADSTPAAPEAIDRQTNTLNIVRFGVPSTTTTK